MNNKLAAAIAMMLFASLTSMMAQSIRGTVTDNLGEPLFGVNVLIKNSSKGVQTDEKGQFELKQITSGTHTLSISYLGFRTKNVDFEVNSNDNVDLGGITLYEGNEILREVVVEGERINKFARKNTAYVSKMPLRDLENTQVYSTITTDLLKSQVATTFEDALKNAVGVEKLWTSTGRGGDGAGYYSLRGFSVQPQLVNGIPGLTNGTINAANIERIEVVKGPSATLFGNAVTSYGGLINVVTKKPYIGFGGELSFTSGTYGFNQISGDFNTPLDKKNNIYFRLNTAYSTQQSFQDAGFKKSFFVAPSLSYQVNDRLSFSFYGEITSAEQTNPTFLFLNRSAATEASNLEELGYNNKLSFTSNDLTLENPTQNYRIEMDYKLSDTWQSQTILSKSSTSTSGYYSYLFDFLTLGDNTFTRYINKQNSNTQTTDIQQNFIGDFKLAGLRNRIVFGIDYYNATSTNNDTGYAFYGNVTPSGGSNGDNPFTAEVEEDAYSLSASAVDAALQNQPVSNIKSKKHIYSAYVSDVLNITPSLSAMAGLRLDFFDNEGDLSTTEDDFDQTAFAPKFGLLYQPILNKLSVFANYQNGFTNVAPQLVGDPSAGAQTLQTFDPEQANQIELGFKTNFFNGRLNSVVSYYDINVKDRVIPGETPFSQVQGGEVRSKGFEIEVNANPIKGLNIRAGYSYNDSEVIEGLEFSSYAEEGRRPSDAGPKNLFNAWANYRFHTGNLEGFGLGIGANSASERAVYDSAVLGKFALPGYTIANASVFYEAAKYRIALKLDNALNEEYYKGWSTINPQMPRALYANFTYRF
ncbi:TonB-dependent receptor [Pseudozobellia sp. WGM2]|uniref:TonB-dependent receptor n=1 Tax=Pseudozobellia sp. WGM2 TaxID=2787625 RepID=UPI001ADF2A00|nr:TonB-dependent receptor [Pseudozobellia sp. WGM2]